MSDVERIARRALERIETHPSTHDQRWWYSGRRHDECRISPIFRDEPTDAAEMAECGTTACVAGHIVIAAAELGLLDERCPETIQQAAMRLLGVDGYVAAFGPDVSSDYALRWLREMARVAHDASGGGDPF